LELGLIRQGLSEVITGLITNTSSRYKQESQQNNSQVREAKHYPAKVHHHPAIVNIKNMSCKYTEQAE
jgi:hypothetical protein